MYYDGGCSLCGREVAHYRRIDKENRVRWVDINSDLGALRAAGIGYDEAMSRLHVYDDTGRIQTGVEAFAAVWDQLPYYRWLARVIRALRLVPTVERVYTIFARWRMRHRATSSSYP